MRLFKRKENRAEFVNSQQKELDTSIIALLAGDEQVTREQTLQIPSVQACINKISDAVSMLPVHLYKRSDSKIEEIFNDHRVELLNGDTGDTLNTVEFWKALISDYYTGRGGWAYIHTSGNKVKSLHYVDCNQIGILQNEDPIFKSYNIQVQGQIYFDFKFIKLLRKTKDGYTNIPLQEESGKVIQATYNSLLLEISMSEGSGCKGGFLKSKNKLSKETINDIREGYTDLYTSFNRRKGRKVLVLNDGMDFQEISSTAAEMQVNENKKTNAVEVCKLFGFPHTIIDGGASETDRRQFNQVVTSLLNQIETELDKCLLLESEKEGGYYFAFDTKELTRGSQKERYEAYEIALRNRFLQVDEVRKEEDYEPMGFNFVSLGLGDVLLNPQTKQIYTPNTNQITYLNDEVRGTPGNPNHDEKGRFSSGGSGGGSSSKDVDKSDESGIIKSDDSENNREDLKKAIQNKIVSTKLDKNAQSKHKLNSEWYKSEIAKGNLPSYTSLSNMEIQTIINNNCCKGKVMKNDQQFKEVIIVSEKIGMFGDRTTGTYIPTNRATIHYSKKGTHLVPAHPN